MTASTGVPQKHEFDQGSADALKTHRRATVSIITWAATSSIVWARARADSTSTTVR
jgi:hypothetical protein